MPNRSNPNARVGPSPAPRPHLDLPSTSSTSQQPSSSSSRSSSSAVASGSSSGSPSTRSRRPSTAPSSLRPPPLSAGTDPTRPPPTDRRTTSFTLLMEALESERAMAEDSFTAADHSTTRETLLRLTLHPPSDPSPSYTTSPVSFLPLSQEVLSTIQSAARQTKRRLLILLTLPRLAPAIRRARRRKRWFPFLQELLGVVYMECERVKQETGRLLAMVDIGIVGWSEPVDVNGWTRVIDGPKPTTDTNPSPSSSKEQPLFSPPMASPGSDGSTIGPSSLTAVSATSSGDPASGATSDSTSSSAASPAERLQPPEGHSTVYQAVALGGTFDHLHSGHRILLSMAAWLASERLIVGITDEALLQKKKHRDLLQSLESRTVLVHRFLSFLAPNLKLSLPPLQDVFGPTITDASISALVVSRETLQGADAIDKERDKRTFQKLDRFVVEVVGSQGERSVGEKEEDIKDMKMGSTAIRGWIAEQLEKQKAKESSTG